MTNSIIPDVGIDCKPLDAVLAYAQAGIPVFPVEGKIPLTPHGFLDATTDEERIQEWWLAYPDAGIGVPTGKASGVDVIDIDPKHGGSLENLEQHSAIPDTRTIATGGGGLHLCFQHRDGVGCRVNVLPGVDVRGDGGFVVVPPSMHPSGNRYSVANNAYPSPMPDELVELVTAPTGSRAHSPDRNDTGFWLACQLRDSGMSRADATAVMERYTEQVTGLRDDEYTYAEAYKSLNQAYSRDPRGPASSQEEMPEPMTDEVASAHLFASRYGHCLKHVTGWGWAYYDGKRWVRGADKQAQELAKGHGRRLLADAGYVVDRHTRDDAVRLAQRTLTASGIEGLLKLARSEPSLSASVDDFDAQPHLLNVENGTLDLRRGELQRHNPKDLLTHICPVKYVPDAEAPRFTRFLEEVFPNDAETVAYLQRFAGYTSTGETREEKWLYLSGTGSNGKGALIRALAYVLGDYATPMAADVLTRSKHHDGGERTTPAYDTLPGKRFVYAQEPEGDALDEGKLKQLVSPDRMYVNPKNLRPYNFQPTHKLWLSANKRLSVSDTSNATWRRTVPIDFNESFTGREDWELEPTLRMDEASGILAWVVAGAVTWYSQGLGDLPAAVKETKKEYRAEQDPASVFFTDVLVPDPTTSTLLADALAAYTAWHDENRWAKDVGNNPRSFAKLARDHGYTTGVVQGLTRIKCARLVPITRTSRDGRDESPNF